MRGRRGGLATESIDTLGDSIASVDPGGDDRQSTSLSHVLTQTFTSLCCAGERAATTGLNGVSWSDPEVACIYVCKLCGRCGCACICMGYEFIRERKHVHVLFHEQTTRCMRKEDETPGM